MQFKSSKTEVLSPPARGLPHVTTFPFAKIAAKARPLAEMCRASLSWFWTALLSPPSAALPQVTTEPSARIAAKAYFVAWMSWTFLSWSWTLVLFPPSCALPHVTTFPSDKIAEKAVFVAQMCWTSLSWFWTALLSPPSCRLPQVTTAPSAKIAAKAEFVARICWTFLSWSWILVLSPPSCALPQVTTVPSARTAAKAALVAQICWTPLSCFRTMALSPPWAGQPHVTTVPSAKIAAKAKCVARICWTFLSWSWTLVLLPPSCALPHVTILSPPKHHRAKAVDVAAILGCCTTAAMVSPSCSPVHWRESSGSNKHPFGAASFKKRCPNECCAASFKSPTLLLSGRYTASQRPLGKNTWSSRVWLVTFWLHHASSCLGPTGSTLRLLLSMGEGAEWIARCHRPTTVDISRPQQPHFRCGKSSLRLKGWKNGKTSIQSIPNFKLCFVFWRSRHWSQAANCSRPKKDNLPLWVISRTSSWNLWFHTLVCWRFQGTCKGSQRCTRETVLWVPATWGAHMTCKKWLLMVKSIEI